MKDYADEEIEEKKFTPPKIHYYKQYPFGRKQKGFFGEDLNSELNPDNKCGMCGRTFNTREEMEDHVYSLGPHNRTTIGESYAKEESIYGSVIDDHFDYQYVMDQDGMYKCKHCGAWLDVHNIAGFTPEEVAKHHLQSEHGITESYAKEDLDIVGSVYKNEATGNEWKVVKEEGELITLQDKNGTEFDTTYGLMHSYTYVGSNFSGESYAKEVEHEKCPHCNFETSWKEGDEWQKEDAKTEMNNHIVTHGTTEARANETTIDKCIHCGRTADNHANPNTDYRGLHGDAPTTDHYYEALDDGVESYATEVEHEKCPHCNFETSWKEGDEWQKEDAKTEMNNHIVTHGTTEGLGQDVSDNWDYGINKEEILAKAGVDDKWADYTWNELPKIIQDQILHTARSYEAMYGYGSATGRMSPRDAWEQGASSEAGLNPIFQEFRTLHWSEIPIDIQELWKFGWFIYTLL